MYKPGYKEFCEYYEKGARIPVMAEVPMSGEDPITVIEKLKLENAPICLLESGKGTENSARYSFLGFNPHLTFRSHGNRVELTGAQNRVFNSVDPYDQLREMFQSYKGIRYEGLPKFYGGAMGYFSYDMGRYFEVMPDMTEDDLALPESYYMFFDNVICFDHVEKKMQIIVTVSPTGERDGSEAYTGAQKKLEGIICSITTREADSDILLSEQSALRNRFVPECNVTKEQFEEMVIKAKEYIRAGDIFQVNLSLRLGKTTSLQPFFLYKVLRKINPSPYMSFINFGDMHIVSSSPELLVRLTGEVAETRPIAGTRRRGQNREEDLALASELISNEKERAEHIMLVDLERNDLGRVCQYGTVEVNELMVIEEYSHVMHIVSNVRGKLASGKDRFDLIRACFPGGTITGAPKIRSMEIIEELEPTRRGPYTGSIGFLGYAGEMEMNIVIRTIIMKNGKAYVQAGAGIVDDSVPEREYFECLKKAEALLRAMEAAEEIQTGQSKDNCHTIIEGEAEGEAASA